MTFGSGERVNSEEIEFAGSQAIEADGLRFFRSIKGK